MKKIISLILCCVMLMGAIPVSLTAEEKYKANNTAFTDVVEGAWYYEAVKSVCDNGYMAGTSNTTFTPNGALTRAMFVTILAAVSGDDLSKFTTENDTGFTDVVSGKWYVKAVKWALEKGVAAGMGSVFGVNKPLTRAQMAVMLYKFAKNGDEVISDSYIDKYADKAAVPTWAVEAVKFVSKYELMSGTATVKGAPYFTPNGTATRAQAAVVINKTVKTPVNTEYPVVDFTLNGNEISKYTIVYGNTASYDDSYANSLPLKTATELSGYIEKATGAVLPVGKDTDTAVGEYEILIGKTNREGSAVTIDRSEFAPETVYIEMQGNYLILASDEVYKATYYAMCSFLEECMGYFVMCRGVEFCTPSVGLNVEDGYIFIDTPDSELRLNSQWGGWEESMRGGEITHSFCNLVHSLAEFAQPDYDGSWDNHIYYRNAGDPCLTDSDNIDNIIKSVKYILSKKSSNNLVWVTETDGVYYCKCENCAKIYRLWGRCATYIQILHYISDAIKDEFPDARLVGMPYKYTHMSGNGLKYTISDEDYAAFCATYKQKYVPNQSLKCPDNVILCVATDNCCASHSIGDTSCKNESNSAVKFENELSRWAEICPNIYILDFLNGTAYEHMVYPIIHRIYDNFRKFYEYGAKGYYSLGASFDYSDFSALKTYLVSRLMWDKDITEKEYYAELDRFLKACYGNGWTYIREYIDKTEELSSKSEWHIWNKEMWSDIISPSDYEENIDYLTELFDKAIALADTDKQIINCKKASVQIRYINLRLLYKHYEDADTDKEAALNEFKSANNDYKAYLEAIGYGVPENRTEDGNPENWFYEAPRSDD